MNVVLLHGAIPHPGLRRVVPPYFKGVAPHLRERFGVRVIEPEVPLTGSVASRAGSIAGQVRRSFGRSLNPSSPIHIIAHSVGGFDARYLISRNLEGLTHQVETLTCIGTPHLGSSIATAMLSLFHERSLPYACVAAWIACLQLMLPEVVMLLFESEAERFNRTCPDNPSVRYLDVCGSGKPGILPTSWLLAPAAMIMSLTAGTEHDGLVSVRSACRGRRPVAVWKDDHAGLVGHDLDRPFDGPGRLHLQRFEELFADVICAAA